MEPFSGELLSILVLVAVVAAGVTLLLLIAVIIYLCRSRRRHSTAVEPGSDHSTASSDQEDERSSSTDTSVASKPPAKRTIRHKRRHKTPVDEYLSDPQSEIDEVVVIPDHNLKKQQRQQQHKRSKPSQNDSIRRDQGRTHAQFYPQRTQMVTKSLVDTRFPDRHTPYPPDVMTREKIMMDHIRFPEKYWKCCTMKQLLLLPWILSSLTDNTIILESSRSIAVAKRRAHRDIASVP